jgi:hypothetical protein
MSHVQQSSHRHGSEDDTACVYGVEFFISPLFWVPMPWRRQRTSKDGLRTSLVDLLQQYSAGSDEPSSQWQHKPRVWKPSASTFHLSASHSIWGRFTTSLQSVLAVFSAESSSLRKPSLLSASEPPLGKCRPLLCFCHDQLLVRLKSLPNGHLAVIFRRTKMFVHLRCFAANKPWLKTCPLTIDRSITATPDTLYGRHRLRGHLVRPNVSGRECQEQERNKRRPEMIDSRCTCIASLCSI